MGTEIDFGNSPNLLAPAGHNSGLLPTNTTVYHSTVRYSRAFYFLSLGGASLGSLLLFISIVTTSEKRGSLFGFAFAFLFITGIVGFILARRDSKKYKEDIFNGNWHQGIIIFPSGDIVVRISRMFRGIDRTIEAAYLRNVFVRNGFSWKRWSFRKYLDIHYTGIDSRQHVISLEESELRDSVSDIAVHINSLREKAYNY